MRRRSGVKIGGVFTVTVFDQWGRFKWKSLAENLVPNGGLENLLDILFAGSSPVSTWYMGLTDGTPTVAAGDTMDSHGGWTEVVNYDEAVRQTFIPVRTDRNVTNLASKAVFTMSSTVTAGGLFLAASPNKGSATASVVLLCGAAFIEGDRSLKDGDTINAQYDFSAADDGA